MAELEPFALILTDTTARADGDIDLEFESGETFSGPCIVLELNVIDAATKKRTTLELVIPATCGTKLLSKLLTADQWDAVNDL